MDTSEKSIQGKGKRKLEALRSISEGNSHKERRISSKSQEEGGKEYGWVRGKEWEELEKFRSKSGI